MALSRMPPASVRRPQGLSIALTGTTGTLRFYLLDEFSRNPIAEQQWHDSCAQRDIGNVPHNARLTFITVNYGLENLGLDSSSFANITEECDRIVHSAWKVDFNQALSSFAENIQSIRTMIDWIIASARRPRILYLSSISSVGPWKPTYKNSTGIPEAPVEDLGAALSIGYSESKQTSERLLDKAASESQVPVTILRVGQVGGARTASQSNWTQRELVPSMLKLSSKSIGLIPADPPPVDWIPVNIYSKVVTELAFGDLGELSHTPRYYHVVNPRPVPWREFVPSLEQYCGSGVQVAPLSQWVKKLRTFDATNVQEFSSKPALKMLNIFFIDGILWTNYQIPNPV